MASQYINLQKSLEFTGIEYLKILRRLLVEDDKVATTKLIRSLRYDVIDGVNGLALEIFAEPYLIVVDQGRKANGKFPEPYPFKEIDKWRRARRIEPDGRVGGAKNTKQLNYLIARSISRNDIQPTYIIKRAQQALLSNTNVIKSIQGGIKIDVEATLQKALQEIQKEFNTK